jgi:hypothetical protein
MLLTISTTYQPATDLGYQEVLRHEAFLADSLTATLRTFPALFLTHL